MIGTCGFWIGFGVGLAALIGLYAILSFQRLEIFKMLLSSFFPLLILILDTEQPDVQASLDTAELTELNRRVGIELEDADAVALSWLQAEGLVS